MKHNLSRCALCVLLPLALSIVSCGPTGGDGGSVIWITADVDSPTTWLSGNVYVIDVYDFYVLDTLTIQPGTIIKFHPTEGPMLTLGGSGTLVADGTAGSPIVFTSFKDDAHGGDTNGDGSATSPARKDWLRIDTNGLNGSVFDHCEFYFGGGGTYTTTLSLSAGSDNVTVTHCTFAHNDGSDASGWYGALEANSGGAGVTIQSNVFYDNVRPLSVSDLFDIDDSNVFHNPANPGETNTCNGVFVYTTTVSSAISWAETEVAFVVDDNDWWISGGTLTLADDVVVKFRPGSVLVLDEGDELINSSGAGVAFTSYKDDARKGDTNGDGATSPAFGDWGGIYDDNIAVGDYVTWGNIYYDSH
jgi:hypothetical protein